jgi:predicted nucleic acid-binding protein
MRVVKWLDTTPEASQYVSVLTLAEIEKGILRKEEGKRRRDLQHWFDEDLPARFAGRILAFDARVASCWAHLTASLLDKGRRLIRDGPFRPSIHRSQQPRWLTISFWSRVT